MNICFVVEGYPYKNDPFMQFTRELIMSIAACGVKCHVIAPQSITRSLKHKLPIRPLKWIDRNNSAEVEVLQPFYFTLSNLFPKLNWLLYTFAAKFAYHHVKKSSQIDVIYAHFWHIGVVASRLETRTPPPIFIACGESGISVQEIFSSKNIEALRRKLSGVIYVGTENYRESLKLTLQKNTPYIIAPNGVNKNEFKPLDRKFCRSELGWDENIFVVSFVGYFTFRKGIDRLSKAIQHINMNSTDSKVYSCFIGSGEIEPEVDYMLFKGKLIHNEICKYLCASDVFVLPTINEGCCNALVEAISCGLPVISSDKAFNDDILDSSCSIRIDSMNISQIEQAILKLRDDKSYRKVLSTGAKLKAKEFDLALRADKIIRFISENSVKAV